ncbi:hypothetical protein CR513_18229, partial [Mucuna pruriens]
MVWYVDRNVEGKKSVYRTQRSHQIVVTTVINNETMEKTEEITVQVSTAQCVPKSETIVTGCTSDLACVQFCHKQGFDDGKCITSNFHMGGRRLKINGMIKIIEKFMCT